MEEEYRKKQYGDSFFQAKRVLLTYYYENFSGKKDRT